VIAAGLVAVAMALPWLTLLPVHGVAAVVAHVAALLAGFHGAGLIVARLSGARTASPWLVMQWGLAGLVGLSGIAIAVGAGTLAVHSVLVFGFVAVHTASVGLRFEHHARRVAGTLGGLDSWAIPAVLLAGLGTLAVLGAAGDTLARPFDDEGNVVAQLRRVLDTGALGDPVGYPRSVQLGAQIALAAIASGAGEAGAALVEPLAMVLVLGLAIAQLRARERSAALWAGVLLMAASAIALAPTDPLPCWTAIGLAVTLYTMLGEAEPPAVLPLALTAGALLAIRYEFAPIAATAVVTAWWRRRDDHHRTAILIGGVFAVGFPFLVARMIAWRSVPAVAHAVLAGPQPAALVLRLALAVAIAVPSAGVLHVALPDSRAMRSAAIATAAALGAVIAHVTSSGPYALRLLWPIAIAFAVILVIELARTRASGAAAMIGALVLCILVQEGREAPGRLRWARRMATAATAIDAVEHPPADPPAPYADLLARVPRGATVAVWVTAADQLDYAHHRIVDLRTPAGARLRQHRNGSARLDSLLIQLSAQFLLVDRDDANVLRGQTSILYRWLCPAPIAPCADELETLAFEHPVVARRGNALLVDLRR
jgi:hypothetical protein